MQSRSQSVRFDNTLSGKLNITYGVPQSSIHGPILFSIYVNNLNEKINVSSLMQYADDTQFLHANTINNLEDLISKTEETLRNIKQYFLSNGLIMLNLKKSHVVLLAIYNYCHIFHLTPL